MADYELSSHTRDMLQERKIPEEWVWRAMQTPDRTEVGADNNTHYIKAISEHGGRFVVVNPHEIPKRICVL